MKALLLQPMPENQKTIVEEVSLQEMKVQLANRIMSSKSSLELLIAFCTGSTVMYTRAMADFPEYDSDQIIDVEVPEGTRNYTEFMKQEESVGE